MTQVIPTGSRKLKVKWTHAVGCDLTDYGLELNQHLVLSFNSNVASHTICPTCYAFDEVFFLQSGSSSNNSYQCGLL